MLVIKCYIEMRLFDQIHICLITMSMMSLLQQVYSYVFTAVLVPYSLYVLHHDHISVSQSISILNIKIKTKHNKSLHNIQYV